MDVNIIPTVALRGVEVLTGGASSVYGSEAISGVVNFQTVQYFNGLRINADYGDAFEGGAEHFDTSAIFGSDGERARGVLAVGYTDRSPLRGRDRDFFDFAIPSSFIGQGTYIAGTNPVNPAAVTLLFAGYGFPGVTNTTQLGFNDDGTLFTQTGAINYDGPTSVDSLFAIVGGNVRQPVGRHGTALKGLERYSAFARGEFDFNNAITGYAQLLYADSTTYWECEHQHHVRRSDRADPGDQPVHPDGSRHIAGDALRSRTIPSSSTSDSWACLSARTSNTSPPRSSSPGSRATSASATGRSTSMDCTTRFQVASASNPCCWVRG